MPGSPLVRAFQRGHASRSSAGPSTAIPEPLDTLDTALRNAIDAGRAAWPSLIVEDDAFAAWLGERAPDPSAAAVAMLDTPALLLTHAVAQRIPGAVEAFHEVHGADIDLALRRVRLPPDRVDDARQLVLEKLLSPTRDKLRAYSGRGSLSHWVRAVTVRHAISFGRRRGTMERVVAEPSSSEPDVAADPELAFLKAHYRDRFKQAFADILEQLPAADRTLLRLRFVDALTLDQLARVRSVHRATIARHLARLRTQLVDAVRTRLAAEAQVGSESELDSVLRLVESNLDLSLPRILGGAD